jgi:hypothetical protein
MDSSENNLKLAVISGASHALRFKAKHPRATDEEVIQYVTNIIEQILKKIDEEE